MPQQKLTSMQQNAFSIDVPSLGTKGSTRPTAGDIINSLFLAQGGGGVIVTYTSNAVANTQDTVAHGLGYTPVGYIDVGANTAGVIYNGANPDATNLYLKSSVASTTYTLIVF